MKEVMIGVLAILFAISFTITISISAQDVPSGSEKKGKLRESEVPISEEGMHSPSKKKHTERKLAPEKDVPAILKEPTNEASGASLPSTPSGSEKKKKGSNK